MFGSPKFRSPIFLLGRDRLGPTQKVDDSICERPAPAHVIVPALEFSVRYGVPLGFEPILDKMIGPLSEKSAL